MIFDDEPEESEIIQALRRRLPEFIKDALPFALETGKRYFYVFCVIKKSQVNPQRLNGFLEMAVSDKFYESSDSLTLTRHKSNKAVRQFVSYDLHGSGS